MSTQPDSLQHYLPTCRLPNGAAIAYQSKAEVQFFYRQIFEEQIYLQHGINIDEGDTICDVGANIGLFSLFVAQCLQRYKIYAFEPAPAVFEILSYNMRAFLPSVKLFNVGVSNREASAPFTFYPNSSGMSSFFGDRNEERTVLTGLLRTTAREIGAPASGLAAHLDDVLDFRLASETIMCGLTTLSRVFDEHGITRVDLLKVDVQKSELDVLHGIEPQFWEGIRQIVIEVHDMNGRVGQVKSLLERHGFDVKAIQEPAYSGSPMFNVYARRPFS